MSPNYFDLYKSLGFLIKAYRQWHHLSQEKFAESIRISVRELRRWEADRERARIENLHDISEVTGIPMQVCIALNADQPLWYSLQQRRFAYSSIETEGLFHELFRYRKPSDDKILLKSDQISADRHINAILSCHKEIYGTEKPLQGGVIKAASKILPDLNRITFDSWGHYVGHIVCLPITTDAYQQLKKQKVLEDYLTTEKMSDILALREGCFFYYSSFATSLNIAHHIVIDAARYLAKIEQKERYLIAAYTALIEAKKFFNHLGHRMVRDFGRKHDGAVPKMYEIELDVLMRPLGPYGWMLKESNRRAVTEDPIREAKQEGMPAIPAHKPHKGSNDEDPLGKKLSCPSLNYDMPLSVVDMPLSVGKQNQDHGKKRKAQVYGSERKTCQNPECTLYGKAGKSNIISNGTYRTKEGTLSNRFLCKECGKSFCNRTTSIFYGLRSPEDKVLTALKLLVKGMPLRGVAKVIEAKPHTVRFWLKVVSEQSGRIDAMLMKDLKASRIELDALWGSVKKNSLRQRAILWKGRKR